MYITDRFVKKVIKELTNLIEHFYRINCHPGYDVIYPNGIVCVRCINFYNAYAPEFGDEVVTYKYKFQIIITENGIDTLYTYEGWCYEEDLKNVAMGIFANWLLSNYKIGECTAWRHMYVGSGNIVEKSHAVGQS